MKKERQGEAKGGMEKKKIDFEINEKKKLEEIYIYILINNYSKRYAAIRTKE